MYSTLEISCKIDCLKYFWVMTYLKYIQNCVASLKILKFKNVLILNFLNDYIGSTRDLIKFEFQVDKKKKKKSQSRPQFHSTFYPYHPHLYIPLNNYSTLTINVTKQEKEKKWNLNERDKERELWMDLMIELDPPLFPQLGECIEWLAPVSMLHNSAVGCCS